VFKGQVREIARDARRARMALQVETPQSEEKGESPSLNVN